MKRLSLIFTVLLMVHGDVFAQINVQLMHQLVNESKEEHSRQENAKNKQAVTTANEEVNKSQMAKLKDRYRQLKSRFHTLGVIVEAAQIGIQAGPIVSEIIQQQSIIYNQTARNPVLIALAIDAERDLAQRSKMLINYLYGLVITAGDINQMKASDRKILFNHVLTELRLIAGTSKGLAANMVYANRKESTNPFYGFINEDKRLVDDIIRKAAVLKN